MSEAQTEQTSTPEQAYIELLRQQHMVVKKTEEELVDLSQRCLDAKFDVKACAARRDAQIRELLDLVDKGPTLYDEQLAAQPSDGEAGPPNVDSWKGQVSNLLDREEELDEPDRTRLLVLDTHGRDNSDAPPAHDDLLWLDELYQRTLPSDGDRSNHE